MSIQTAPCEWPIIPCPTCNGLEGLDEPTQDAITEAATSYLWNWTRRLFGLCSVTVRPCRTDCPEVTTYHGAAGVPGIGTSSTGFVPQLVAGEWRNLACPVCKDRCSCDTVQSIRLPGPVDSITAVTIDGAALDPSAYRVDNRSLLIRDDGEAWPACQNLGKPAGAEGTWTVEYLWGVPVPAGGQLAAGMLACQMAKAWCGARDCQLPERIQSITRQGVTVAVVDAFEGLERGRTGIWMVDSWVESQTRPPRRSGVHVPNRAAPTRTTFRGS